MHDANSVEEAVESLEKAQLNFSYSRIGMGMENPYDAWDNFKKCCQQLSGWIEHGRGVTDEMKPELTKKLFAAEKILLQYRQYSREKLYYKE